VAAEAGMTADKVRELKKLAQQPTSLNKVVGDEGDSELGDLVENEEAPDGAEIAPARDLEERLAEVLVTALTPRERRIIQLRWGLLDDRRYTQEEVAQRLGIKKGKVRQIEGSAMEKLGESPVVRELWRAWKS
jgi:RNA polymerase primary sigma factor